MELPDRRLSGGREMGKHVGLGLIDPGIVEVLDVQTDSMGCAMDVWNQPERHG